MASDRDNEPVTASTPDGTVWTLIDWDLDGDQIDELVKTRAGFLVDWCWGAHADPTYIKPGDPIPDDVFNLLPTDAQIKRRRRGKSNFTSRVERWSDDRNRNLLRMQDQ